MFDRATADDTRRYMVMFLTHFTIKSSSYNTLQPGQKYTSYTQLHKCTVHYSEHMPMTTRV